MKETLEAKRAAAEQIKKQARINFPVALDEIRNVILSGAENEGRDMIGIFGGYRAFGGRGTEIIRNTARKFAGAEYLVITGFGLFCKENGEIKEEDIINTALDEVESEFQYDAIQRSIFFASITPYAIFLLSETKDTSSHEQYEFSKNTYSDKKMGIGIFITNDNFVGWCSFIRKEESPPYLYCGGSTKRHCETNEGKCPWIDSLGIPSSDAFMYVKSPRMIKIIIGNEEEIFDVAQYIFRNYASI